MYWESSVKLKTGKKVSGGTPLPATEDKIICETLGVIDDQAELCHQLLDVPEAQKKPQVPPNTGDDDFRFEVASTKEGRSRLLHAPTLKTSQLPCNTSDADG